MKILKLYDKIMIVVIEMYVPIIPCYNPPDILLEIIDELIKCKFNKIIIVDDGSNDKEIFQKIKKIKECVVITHDKNMGKGMALKSGISYYKNNLSDKYYGVVCLDCDGQHAISDMRLVGDEMVKSNNFTLGVRNFDLDGVPIRNKLGNKITCMIFKWLFDRDIKDTQSGLRGIPNRLIDIVLNTSGDRYEYEINMLIDMVYKNEIIQEVEINTIYNREKRYSYFKVFRDSFSIYKVMFKRCRK